MNITVLLQCKKVWEPACKHEYINTSLRRPHALWYANNIDFLIVHDFHHLFEGWKGYTLFIYLK